MIQIVHMNFGIEKRKTEWKVKSSISVIGPEASREDIWGGKLVNGRRNKIKDACVVGERVREACRKVKKLVQIVD